MCVVTCVAMSIPVQAQWSGTSGPEGGFAAALLSTPQVMLLGLESGGVYRSTDDGTTWHHASVGLTGERGRASAADSKGENEMVKYTIALVSLTLLVLAGCGETQQVGIPTERLELISMTPLPPVSLSSYAAEMRLSVLMHIMEDGTVEELRMLGSSGDSDWDSLALQVMKQWRYAGPRWDGVPIDVWIRQPLLIRVQEPIVMNIGEIVSASLREADSLCLLLEKETDLDPLFKQAIGTVDIVQYPPNVRDQLKRLSRGENTNPLRVGDTYVIYKRFR